MSVTAGNLIDKLTQYLRSELADVETHIGGVLDSDIALVREVGQYVLGTGGKRLRPMLAMLASKACGYRGDSHPRLGAALEMIHTATLVHDDVIDRAQTRRSKQTVNAKWGNEVAILIADFLFSRSFELAMDVMRPEQLRLLCGVTARMCEGEMFQIEKGDMLLTESDYLSIVEKKTAYLFSACTALGGQLAQATEQETAALTAYGLSFGIAFQITDDTLDLVSDDSVIGKPNCADIRNGKQTLPLIRTLAVAEPDDREDLWKCWNDGRDPARIMRHIRKYRGIEYALDAAKRYAVESCEHLKALAPSPDADLLRQLSEYVVSREY